MIIPGYMIHQSPRFFNLLEKLRFTSHKGKDVVMNPATMIAAGALFLTLLGSMYGLVIAPLQEALHVQEALQHEQHLDHEIRIRAGEISDSRTGVHLENLTRSIDTLVRKIEMGDRQ